MNEIRKYGCFEFCSGIITDRIHRHLKGGLEVVKYHGPGRPKDLDTISDSDIIVTTYNTLTAEFLVKSKPSILHRIGWYRVVLDEGKPQPPFSLPKGTPDNLQHISSAAQLQPSTEPATTSTPTHGGVSPARPSKTNLPTSARSSPSPAPSRSPGLPSSASGLRSLSSRTSRTRPLSRTAW